MESSAPQRRPWTAQQIDRLMLGALLLNGLLAMAIGHSTDQLGLALQIGAALLGLAAVLVLLVRIDWLSRAAVVVVLAGLVALQIHLAQGSLAFHFNVFISLSLLIVYRDWRPIAAMALLLAAQHLAFDRLRAAGMPLYHLPSADLARTSLHVAVIAIHSLFLGWMAWRLQRDALEARELAFLVNAMGPSGAIRLNLEVMRADTQAAQRLKHIQQRMAQVIGQVRATTRGLQEAAEASARIGSELTDRAQMTVSGLKEASISLDQIGVIARSTTEASTEAKLMSSTAASMADKGGELVGDVVSTMREIENSSRRITDIIGVIDGIAFQTNILALNAAVEAARAGDQGRGFAVVASEVRNLARRSADAAKEIKALIGQSTSTVAHGTSLVAGAGQTMNELVESVRRVGELFSNITSDAKDHAEGLQMVSQAMRDLEQLTQGNLDAAERADQTAQALQQEVGRLDEVLSAFRLGSGDPSNGAVAPSVGESAAMPARPTPSRSVTAGASQAAPAAAAAGKDPAPKPGGSIVEFF